MIRPMLDDIELPLVLEVVTHDRRMLSELKPPGMSGSVVQNLGRQPVRVLVRGFATGPAALETVQAMDNKLRAAQPVPFVGDIVADANIDLVMIEDLQLRELAGKPERFSYELTLREFIKPVEPPAADPQLDLQIAADALDRVNGLADALAGLQALSTGLERFVPVFTDLLTRLQAFKKP